MALQEIWEVTLRVKEAELEIHAACEIYTKENAPSPFHAESKRPLYSQLLDVP
jgi:hypothetical protein